jgi:acyl-CoA thioesterase FadM
MDKIFAVKKEDCDRFGLVRYRRYLDWIHETRAAFMEELGAGDDLLASKGIDMVTVNLNLRNLEACSENDRVEVIPQLVKVMDHALYYIYTGRNAKTAITVFIAHTEMYPVSREGRLMKLPPEMVDALSSRVS